MSIRTLEPPIDAGDGMPSHRGAWCRSFVRFVLPCLMAALGFVTIAAHLGGVGRVGSLAGAAEVSRVAWFIVHIVPGVLLLLFAGLIPVLAGWEARRERDLNESAHRIAHAADRAEIGFWERDLSDDAVTWNGAMHRIYGTDPARFDPDPTSWCELVHPADLEQLLVAFDEAVRAHDTFDATFRIVRRDSATRTVRTIASVVVGASGVAERVVGAHLDVTELTDTTRRLEETATRLGLAMEAGRIGQWDIRIKPGSDSPDRESAWCDETLHRLLGYEAGELESPELPWHAVCHPDDLELMRGRFRDFLDGKTQTYNWDYRVRAKSGHWVWVHDAGEVIERDATGRPTRMVGVRALIDEQKRAEVALQSVVALGHESGELGVLPEITRALAEAFDVAYVGIALLDRDAGNDMAEVVAGWWNGGPAPSMRYSLAGTPCDVSVRRSYCMLRTGVCEAFPEDRDLRDLGAESYAGVVIRDRDGQPIGVLYLVHDRPLSASVGYESILRLFAARASTEIERCEAERRLVNEKSVAERANATKSEFLAHVSHEIRTPIQAMIGFADLLTESAASDEKMVRDFAKTISRNGGHLLTLVNDLLDTSKIEAGQMKVERIGFDLAELVRDVHALLAPRIREKGLAFRVRCETPIPSAVDADPVRLRQVLVNLVGNAAKFTMNGSVTLRIRHDDESGVLSIAVEDTGIGIPASRVEDLFQPFTQADRSTVRRFGGTGLGLSISRHLARLMGGDITVTSVEGSGSVFTASLDVGGCEGVGRIAPDAFEIACESAGARGPVAGPVRPALYGIRVLLVEDSVDNQRLLRFHLQAAGASVRTAGHGGEALDLLEHKAGFDVVVSDMQMPVMDGYTLASEIRRRGDSTPIIALTAHATPEDESRCLDAGCTLYQTKPISREKLVAACLRVVPSAAERDARAA